MMMVMMLLPIIIYDGLRRILWARWYVCLKTENCYLKTFVEIRVGEKMY